MLNFIHTIIEVIGIGSLTYICYLAYNRQDITKIFINHQNKIDIAIETDKKVFNEFSVQVNEMKNAATQVICFNDVGSQTESFGIDEILSENLFSKFLSSGICDLNQKTLVHYCAESGDINLLNKIISSGASVYDLDSKGYLPIHYACQEGHLDIVKLLVLKFQSSISDLTNDGWSPLDLAAYNAHKEITKFLFSIGATTKPKSEVLSLYMYEKDRESNNQNEIKKEDVSSMKDVELLEKHQVQVKVEPKPKPKIILTPISDAGSSCSEHASSKVNIEPNLQTQVDNNGLDLLDSLELQVFGSISSTKSYKSVKAARVSKDYNEIYSSNESKYKKYRPSPLNTSNLSNSFEYQEVVELSNVSHREKPSNNVRVIYPVLNQPKI